MAEKETKNQPKDLIEAVPEEIEKLSEDKLVAEKFHQLEKASDSEFRRDPEKEKQRHLESWVPKTKLGKEVKSGKESDFDKIILSGKKILEPEIADSLLNLETDLILVGQAKGKFGGGKRRAWRQTQKKTKEGNVITFAAMAVTGDRAGHIGIGYGKATETLPSREKAIRNSKLGIIKVIRGFESIEEKTNEPHTVPFKVNGKCGSVRITLFPAPRGTGLVVGDESKKVLRLAGIKDVYARTVGQSRTSFNLVKACIEALRKTNEVQQ